MSTKIDWCDEVWNPTTGCSKGCFYCYARPFAKRMKYHPNDKISEAYQRGFMPTCHADRLDIPFKWKKSRRIFVDSMGDLFDPVIDYWFIDKVMATVSLLERHTFMILTKQPERMCDYFQHLYTPPLFGANEPIENLWLGVSVTNQAEADQLINKLAMIPAAKRFLSAEPMIGPVNMPAIKGKAEWKMTVDWVICGGMTGPGAIPLNYEWVASLRDQCLPSGVPFFFKGWGKWLPGAQIDGREWREFPS